MTTETVKDRHEHQHGQNRFAVLPTQLRMKADPNLTGKGVTMAFLDSGFYPHPDLTEPSNRIIAYEDVARPGASLEATEPPESWAWHGTQTSVVAAGNGHLSDGIYRGLASDAQVVLAKAGDNGKITEENIERGLRWIIDNRDRYNIRVVSISLGGDWDVPSGENAVDLAAEEAIRRGIVVVVAAGNSGCTENHRTVPPANSPSVITVGGYDDKNQPDGQLDLYCSSYGETADRIVKPEIIAPAIWVAAPILPGTDNYAKAEALTQIATAPDYLLSSLSPDLWDRAGLPQSLRRADPQEVRPTVESLLKETKIVAAHYQHVDGTSFAAPIVSSLVAQMIEANPRLTPAAIKHILISTADRIQGAPAIRQGYGVVNAPRATAEARREHHTGEQVDFCPPRMEGERMVFVYHNDSAEKVSLVGDFNGWDMVRTPLLRDDSGIWRAEIDAPAPGRNLYKLVVNGTRWIEDPANGLKEPDSYGGFNSVLNVN